MERGRTDTVGTPFPSSNPTLDLGFGIHSTANKTGEHALIRHYRYIGAEDGIYQFHINLHGRKVFPEITFR